MQTTAGFTVNTSFGLDRMTEADLIVLVAGSWVESPPNAQLVKQLHAARDRGAHLMAICRGAFVLAAAGLLDGLRATTHWRWTEEMARFLLVWMVMLGAMLGVRERIHFEVDVWPHLSPRAAARLDIVSGLAVLVFAMTFLWWGFEFTRFAWRRFSELAELPLWTIHMAWPVCGAMWVLFQGERMVDAVRVLRRHDGGGDGAAA